MKKATQSTEGKKRVTKTDIQQFLLRGRAFIALIIVLVVFAVLTPQFLTTSNIVIMSKHVAINALLAIGMTFVILTGGIDLSVGSIVGMIAMIAGGLINEGINLPRLGIIVYPHTWMVIVISLALGTLMGAINGFIIARFNVAPFIATLGMLYVARGIAGLRNDGYTFPNLVGRPEYGNTGFGILGSGELLGINYSIWLMVLFAIVAYIITTRSPFGRHVYAIGGNENAAKLSGVRVGSVKIIVYSISGFCSALVGLIWASQLLASHPMSGDAAEMTAIAAVVLGGTSLAGGQGGVGGTLIGAFVIGILGDGLVMMGVSSFWQKVIKGAVIVFTVILDQVQARMQERIALQKQEELK
ncbi:MAG TPA: sugar ABC transporter permease [Anaerolineaceae bacterium]|nr:sugar ABC transporter permease [Anaerolineaceae bacterium]